MVQLQFIISKTRIKRDQQSDPKATKSAARKPVKKGSKRAKAKEQAIDSSLFSKFQENLSQSTQSTATTEQEDVVLSLSSKSKTKNLKQTGKTPPTEKSSIPVKAAPKKTTASSATIATGVSVPDDISVAPIGSIFDDIADPPEIASRKIDPVKRPAKKLKQLAPKNTPTEAVAGVEAEAPLPSKEILTENDFIPDEESSRDEAEISLTLAESYFKKKEFDKSLSALKQFLDEADTEGNNPDAIIKMVWMKGECEIKLEDFEQASKTLQDYFKNQINNQHPQYLDQLEHAIGQFVDADQQQYAVHFLFTALNEFRQLHEFHKMDELYTEIESAYHQKQDMPRLTQTYQNHLAIKKTIKDFKGQLDILDHLGKLLYDQGDDEGSRRCYEQRLAVENQMEQS